MEDSKDVIKHPESSSLPVTVAQTKEAAEWEIMKQMARYAIDSGFMPKSITRPQQALIIMQKGKELGLQPMEALGNIHVINGKASLSAELMLALFLKRIKGAKVEWVKTTNDEAEAVFSMADAKPYTARFTMDDARRAGLLNNPSWQKYPAALLRARLISAAIRAYAPHATLGCYTPEEMGEEVVEGELVEPPSSKDYALGADSVKQHAANQARAQDINKRFGRGN